MNKQEVGKILSVLRVAYPAFYSKMGQDDALTAVELWYSLLKDYDYPLVSYAVQSVVKSHTGYPPDIATIIEKVESITAAANGEPTPEELFGILRTAVSYYDAQEKFAALPPVLQRYCGSPERLREYAKMQSETFETVVHGQFLREIKVIEERVKADQEIPEPIKAIAAKMRMPELEAPQKTEEQIDKRRVEVLDKIDAHAMFNAPKPYKPLSAEEIAERKKKLLEALNGRG